MMKPATVLLLPFNTVIKGLCNEGEVGAAMALFRRMPQVPRQNGTGVSPNFETYIMLLEALVNKRLFDTASEVCKECLRNKWAPPFQAVKALVQGLLKSRKAKQANEVLVAMRKAVKGDAKQEWIKVEAHFQSLASSSPTNGLTDPSIRNRTPLARVRLDDLAPFDGASTPTYASAVDAIAQSLARHGAAALDLPAPDAAIVRCGLESARSFFRARPGGLYVYRAGR
nr:unnamed protein product [Digitaria exilis]